MVNQEKLIELVKLADALRSAQKAYMANRGNESLGAEVGNAARAYDELRSTMSFY